MYLFLCKYDQAIYEITRKKESSDPTLNEKSDSTDPTPIQTGQEIVTWY
jgi:hypothetical protein